MQTFIPALTRAYSARWNSAVAMPSSPAPIAATMPSERPTGTGQPIQVTAGSITARRRHVQVAEDHHHPECGEGKREKQQLSDYDQEQNGIVRHTREACEGQNDNFLDRRNYRSAVAFPDNYLGRGDPHPPLSR